MRSSFTATSGLKLSRTPGVREDIARRRLTIAAAVLTLLIAGVGLGLMSAPDRGEAVSQTGPFSYFPSE